MANAVRMKQPKRVVWVMIVAVAHESMTPASSEPALTDPATTFDALTSALS